MAFSVSMASGGSGAEVPVTSFKTGLPGHLFILSHDTELRIEAEAEKAVKLVLCKGTAEVFGTELVSNHVYSFPAGARLAVYTWYGCEVVVNGDPHRCYKSDTTPMVKFLNLQMVVEQERERRKRSAQSGPAVLVAGPLDVGKSTLCRILLNYTIRSGTKPLLVDLDVGQGNVSIPGSIGAQIVDQPAHPALGFLHQTPLVFHYGHLSPASNAKLYDTLVSQLAARVRLRYEALPEARYAGCLINSCGWVEGTGYASLLNAAREFRAYTVIVLDHEKLFVDMQRDLPAARVLHFPKSGGVVARTKAARKASRRDRTRAYFYGTRDHLPLSPHSIVLPFEALQIYQITETDIPASLLPIGETAEGIKPSVSLMSPSPQMITHILAVSSSEDPDTLLTSPTMGFLCVTDLSQERSEITLLSPQPPPLPKRCLLFSDITFMDLQ